MTTVATSKATYALTGDFLLIREAVLAHYGYGMFSYRGNME